MCRAKSWSVPIYFLSLFISAFGTAMALRVLAPFAIIEP